MSRQQMMVRLQEVAFRRFRRSATGLAVVGLVLFGSGVLTPSSAPAGTINHGDFTGSTVMYTNVTETSDDPVPLYGTPVTLGDTLSFFQPGVMPDPSLGFSATAPPSDTTDGFLSFGVMANAGFGISSLEITEGGDYSMSALSGESAQVSANLIVQALTITHVDGALLATPIVATSLDSIVVDFPPGPSPDLWDLSSSFDIDQLLIDAGVSFSLGATKLTVALDNTLQALATSGAAANIVKKDFDIDVETRVIPEPATCALGMLGLTMVLASRRRKI